MDLFELIKDRKSCRVFKPDPIPQELIREILFWAGQAPSAINVQPWEFIVVSGNEKQRLTTKLVKAQEQKRISCGPGTSRPLPEPWIKRPRELMAGLTKLMEEMQVEPNHFITMGSCRFYGAPVALLVCLDRLFPTSRLLCLGMALGYLFLAAQAKGLATCPIGLITSHEEVIKDHLNIPEEKQIVLGVALGYADSLPINSFKSSREEIGNMIRWIS